MDIHEDWLNTVFFNDTTRKKGTTLYAIKFGDKVFKSKNGKWTYRSKKTAKNALVERLYGTAENFQDVKDEFFCILNEVSMVMITT